MTERVYYPEQPTLPGVDPYDQGEQPILPDMSQFESPTISTAKQLLEKGDWIMNNLAIIDANLVSGELTQEGYTELMESKRQYVADYKELIKLGNELGYFSDGAPQDNYSRVAA